MIPDNINERPQYTIMYYIDLLLWKLGLARLSTCQWIMDNPSDMAINEVKALQFDTIKETLSMLQDDHIGWSECLMMVQDICGTSEVTE